MIYHNKPAMYKNGLPTKEEAKMQSRIIHLQNIISTKIVLENYKPKEGDEFQAYRDEIKMLREKLGIRGNTLIKEKKEDVMSRNTSVFTLPQKVVLIIITIWLIAAVVELTIFS